MNLVERIAAGVLLVALVGCGGGGGGGSAGGDTPLSYTGNTNPAAVTTSNASALTAHVMTGGETSQAISSLAAPSPTGAGGGMIDIGRQLHLSLRKSVAQLRPPKSRSDAISAVDVNEVEPCDNGGSVRFFGTLNDNGTGTISIQFNACQSGAAIVGGNGTMRIDTFLFGFGPVDYTLTFTRLTLSGSSAGAVSGTLRVQVDPSARKETTTENAVVSFGNGIMGKSENLVSVTVFDSLSNPTSYTESMSGRVFHSVHGFVDVSTTVPLIFGTVSQEFPNNGVLLLTGAGGAAMRVMALSPARLTLALDLDGNGVFEKTVPLAWSDLTGLVGADLNDDDNDGMHNSWEVAHALDPKNASDALADADGDGASNLAEYQGGTNPRDAGSQPSGVGLSLRAITPPDPVFVGGRLTYNLSVSNSNFLAADNVVVVDTLPAGVRLVSAAAANGSCTGTGPVTCTLGTINAFSAVGVTIVVSPTTEGILTNTATVSTSSFDPVTSDNTATTVITAGLPAPGLQGRIDVASDGDTIRVDPGLYTALDFLGKNIVLLSTGGPAGTTIHGGGSTTAVRMGPGGSIIGFTITGGAAAFGAGIEVSGAGSLISGNIFDGNAQSAGGFGAAIGGNGASPTIERNIFRNNTCDDQFVSGVVAFISSSSPRIVNNLFVNNACRGINLTLFEGNTPQIINNTFVGNRTAIRVDTRASQVTQTYRNNILVQNGIGFEIVFGSPTGSPVWTNNLVSANGVDYQGTVNLTGTAGNITGDPRFVDQVAGNYDLQGTSPAIDAGSALGAPTVDLEGASRLRVVDIGAFEGP